ncbi:MAG: transglycosylase SLT domain-containing protein, partial [Candidatus Competibacteraceae bacterium]
ASRLKPESGINGDSGPRLTRRWWIPLFVIALAISIGGDVGATESLRAQREAFRIAEYALRVGAPIDYSPLRAYPLYPYLRYQDLTRRLAAFPTAEVREFLREYADSPPADRLRDAWLRQLANAGRWDDYLSDSTATRDPTLDCWRRQALLNTEQSAVALDEFAAIWLHGRSLPNVCDPIIAAWQARGGLTPELLWQRFALAMENRDSGLARFLRGTMSEADQKLADSWLAVAENPRLILDAARFETNDPRVAAILSDGLSRWRRSDALAALTALDALKQRAPQLAAALADEERLLALWIASDYHPTALARLATLPETVVDQDVREWRIRIALRQGDWKGVLHGLEQLPPEERGSPRWQYWRGRALEALEQTEPARQAYRNAAERRDYYSFLAADRIGASYILANDSLTATATELEALLVRSPGLQRARELYILGREPEAANEWRRAIQDFDRAALRQAALLARRWDWHSQAIVTIARAEHWDDLELRFPLAHRERVVDNARTGTVEPAWVYAVIRQESAFRADARSPAGALGLMQVMPATGRQIARELREDSANPPLLQPDVNIRYGVHYLGRMLERLQDNPVLATAAYNAGPNRVAQWLPTSEALPADVWAETIPYRETRTYVQRVLEYAIVYQHRLGVQDPETTLSTRMKPVLPEAAGNEG